MFSDTSRAGKNTRFKWIYIGHLITINKQLSLRKKTQNGIRIESNRIRMRLQQYISMLL